VRPTALFIGYMAIALVIGALIAYPVYLEVRRPIDEPMYRFVTRGGMLVAFLGSPFLLRYLHLTNAQSLGYRLPRRGFFRDMLVGLLAGIVIMLLLVMMLVALDVRLVKPDWIFSWSDLFVTAVSALISGFVIALIEEMFFRGAMSTAVNRYSGLWPAVVLPSLLYAAVHFIKTTSLPTRFNGIADLSCSRIASNSLPIPPRSLIPIWHRSRSAYFWPW
jgi:membrane protease YdiL (CAAX protease family)